MADGWELDEVELTVADYFSMLDAELSGRPYNKAEHNQNLRARIRRSKGSIEFKHQNISAVLHNFRQPYIAGYLPRQNYQKLLEQVVLEWLSVHPRFFEGLAHGPVLAPAQKPPIASNLSVTNLIEDPPRHRVEAEPKEAAIREARFYQTDFVRRDAENRRLGRMGEEWVVEFERRRLTDELRRPDLAKHIEWIASTRGDGVGYDVTSFNEDESARLIEVKTTGLGKEFPFMVTANEVRVSHREHKSYHLYRLFEFSKSPRLFVLRGSIKERCRLEATQYRAYS
jgi:uncharacterized protein DUF3883